MKKSLLWLVMCMTWLLISGFSLGQDYFTSDIWWSESGDMSAPLSDNAEEEPYLRFCVAQINQGRLIEFGWMENSSHMDLQAGGTETLRIVAYLVEDGQMTRLKAAQFVSSNEDIVRVYAHEEHDELLVVEAVNFGEAIITCTTQEKTFEIGVCYLLDDLTFYSEPIASPEYLISEFAITEKINTFYLVGSRSHNGTQDVILDQVRWLGDDDVEVVLSDDKTYASITLTKALNPGKHHCCVWGTYTTEAGAPNGTYCYIDIYGGNEVSVTVSEQEIQEAISEEKSVLLSIDPLKDYEVAYGLTWLKIDLPEGVAETVIEIPVENVNFGTVVMNVLEDGTEEVIPSTVKTEAGVAVKISDGANLRVIDNTKHFVDVAEEDWELNAVTFASSRQLFQGAGSDEIFNSDIPMTRGMILTVLARFNGVDTSWEEGHMWYDPGVEWAVEIGLSDGSNPEDNVTREQLATILWRYMGQPTSEHSLVHFDDANEIHEWPGFVEAMRWANEVGIINGTGDGKLDPLGMATRGQVAQMLMNFIQKYGTQDELWLVTNPAYAWKKDINYVREMESGESYVTLILRFHSEDNIVSYSEIVYSMTPYEADEDDPNKEMYEIPYVFNGKTYYYYGGLGYSGIYEVTNSEVFFHKDTNYQVKFRIRSNGDLLVTEANMGKFESG